MKVRVIAEDHMEYWSLGARWTPTSSLWGDSGSWIYPECWRHPEAFEPPWSPYTCWDRVHLSPAAVGCEDPSWSKEKENMQVQQVTQVVMVGDTGSECLAIWPQIQPAPYYCYRPSLPPPNHCCSTTNSCCWLCTSAAQWGEVWAVGCPASASASTSGMPCWREKSGWQLG